MARTPTPPSLAIMTTSLSWSLTTQNFWRENLSSKERMVSANQRETNQSVRNIFISDLEDVEAVTTTARGRDFLESPISDGTIDEDFAEALAKEVDVAGKIGSPTTPMVNTKTFGGNHTTKLSQSLNGF